MSSHWFHQEMRVFVVFWEEWMQMLVLKPQIIISVVSYSTGLIILISSLQSKALKQLFFNFPFLVGIELLGPVICSSYQFFLELCFIMKCMNHSLEDFSVFYKSFLNCSFGVLFQVSPERGIPPPSSPGGSAIHYFEGKLFCKVTLCDLGVLLLFIENWKPKSF